MDGTCLACGSPPRPCHASFVCVAGSSLCPPLVGRRWLHGIWDQTRARARARAQKINQQSQGLHCSNQAARSLQRQMQGLLCHPRKRQCAADLMIPRPVLLLLLLISCTYRPCSVMQTRIGRESSNDLSWISTRWRFQTREGDNRTRCLARSGNGSATPLPPKSWESRGGPPLAGQTKETVRLDEEKKKKVKKKVKLTQSQTVTDDTEQAMQRH